MGIFISRMAENDKFIGTIIISNIGHIDLFKVHVHEKSIRFDPKFANGIASNDGVSSEIMKVDSMWKNGKIRKDDIFTMIANIVGKYEPYLSDYYFGMSELDMKGRYIGEFKIEEIISKVTFEDRMRMYYAFLNGAKKMKSITKDEFENHLPKAKAETYLDAFEPKGTTYFKYDTVDINRKPKTCYVMAKNDSLKFAFCL